MTQSSDERRRLPHASRWPGYELCPGSFQLELEAERLGQLAHETSPAAKRGTLIHAYLAGQPDEDGKEIVLTDTERTTADFLQERAQGEVARIFGEEPVQQLDEKRLWLVLSGQRVASGQFDRVVYSSSVALVQDFKTGWSEPEPAEQNAQGKLLAVLVALHMPKTLREVVVQLISGPFGISEARYDMAALGKAYESILSTLRAIHDPMAPLNPSPEACRYCPAKLICPALQDKRIGIARMELITLPDGPQASMILDDVAMIRSRCDEIVAYYEAKLLADPSYELPGYAMAQGAPRRSVSDWPAARAKLEEFVGAEALDQLAAYSIPAVEKVLGEAIGMRGSKLKDQFSTILGDLLELKYPEPGLKRVKMANMKALEAT